MENLDKLKSQLQSQLLNHFNNTNGQNTEDSIRRLKKLVENIKAIGIEIDETFILNAEKYPADFMDLIAYSEMNILTRVKDIKQKLTKG